MRYLITVCSCLLLIVATAQTQKKWYLLPQLGLLNGTGVVSGQAMLTGGLVQQGWDLGIGVGVDYYSVRTVPIVADIRKHIGALPMFGYINAGYNIAAALKNEYMYPTGSWNISNSSFSNGWYGELGLGYDLPLKKNQHLLLSLGYSVKTAGEHYTETIPRDFPPYYGETNEHSFDYTFKRVVFKLGFRL